MEGQDLLKYQIKFYENQNIY